MGLPPGAPDPRAALGHSLAAQLSMLLNAKVEATWLLNPAPMGGAISCFALFSYSDGTSAAAVLMDLPLSCLLGAALLGAAPLPPAHIETLGDHPKEVREALQECCNVFAALLNSAQPRRVKLTGLMLGPADLDLEELNQCRLEYSVAIEGLGTGRLAWLGRSAAAAAIACSLAEHKAAKEADLQRASSGEGLRLTVAKTLQTLIGHEVPVSEAPPLTITAAMRAAVAVYSSRIGKPPMAVVSELSLTAMLGSAPMMIPPAVVAEQTKVGKLSGSVLDGAHEVFNILAGPFAWRKLYLTSLQWLPGTLTGEAATLIRVGAKIPCYQIEVPGYGEGRMGFVGA